MKEYNHKKIEEKWRDKWVKGKIYLTDEDEKKPKSFVLDMFPYPSGEGLHAGHVRVYTASDVYSRYKQMQGYRVLHPTGWDAFGLPAEQFAIKNKVHPREAVNKNVANFKRQMNLLGFSYDWDREIDTTSPEYYKWTQWIFLKLLEKGLAYESYEPINWCPSCQTGLANEDLDGNVCERCGTVVEKKPMRQWVLKITDYAERLTSDLSLLTKWPPAFCEAQKNWIGKSDGAEIEFKLSGIEGQEDGKHSVKVFTTRPDTLFGATFVAISAELSRKWTDAGWKTDEKIKSYIQNTLEENKTHSFEEKEKTGIFSGIYAVNPANQEKIPVWVVNYVLGDVGTGAIMAVPAHDTRDYEFASKFGITVKTVVEPVLIQTTGTAAFRNNEPVSDSHGIIAIVKHWSQDKFMSLRWPAAGWGTLITGGIDEGFTPEETVLKEILEETGYKNAKIIRKIGVIHSKYYHEPKKANRFGHAPVFYVEIENDERDPISPEESVKHELLWLSKEELKSFLTATSHLQALAFLKANVYTGPGFIVNSGKFDGLDSEEAKEKITEFVGGKRKTTYKLRDWVFSRQRYWGEPIPVVHCENDGVVPVPESELPVLLPEVKSYEPTGTGESPLAEISEWVNTKCPKCGGPAKRETNTMPQWAGSSWYYLRFIDPKNDKALVDPKKEKDWMPVDVYVGGAEHATRHLIYARFWHKFLYDLNIVSTEEPFTRLESVGLILGEGGTKMSKRVGNVVNPDEIVEIYGADTLRIYEMFIGPFGQASVWDMKSIIGPRRFLEKVWRIGEKIGEGKLSGEAEIIFNQTVKKVSEDIDVFKFNTAISQMMILAGELEKIDTVPRGVFEALVKLIAPFAPFMAEELWSGLGYDKSVHKEVWPKYNAEKLAGDTLKIVIQINGKVRGNFEVLISAKEDEIKDLALTNEVSQRWLMGRVPAQIIYVPGKLVNIVV